MSRVMNKIDDFKRLNIKPDVVAPWEDGRRDNSLSGHAEIWYLDCTFDDGSTLVLGFRPKSVDNLAANTDNPNVAINYTGKNAKTYYDYRLYNSEQAFISTEACDLKFGPSTLQGDWQNYTVHIEPENNYELTMEGKTSFSHDSAVDLSFKALTQPFRPGTGYISLDDSNEYYYNFICITRLEVSGHIKIDGEDKKVEGFAYYNHQWMNISPTIGFHHWLWGRQNIGDYSVMIYDMVAAEKFNFDQIPLFILNDKNGRRIFENTSKENMSIRILDSYVQQETQKRYPSKILYNFKNKNIDIKYTISMDKEINIINFYKNASQAEKSLYDKLHLQPTYTRYLAHTDLEINDNKNIKRATGSMLYEFNYPGLQDSRALDL